MTPIYVAFVGIAATVATASIGVAAGMSPLGEFITWIGAPFFAHFLLALERDESPGAARGILFGTAFGAALATLAYWVDLKPFIDARRQGNELMNCGPPIVEFGIPVLQWAVFAGLWKSTRAQGATDEPGPDQCGAMEQK